MKKSSKLNGKTLLLCDVPHWIGEKVPGAIYVETPLNQVDAF